MSVWEKLYPAFHQWGIGTITDENSARIGVVEYHMEYFIDSTDLSQWWS